MYLSPFLNLVLRFNNTFLVSKYHVSEIDNPITSFTYVTFESYRSVVYWVCWIILFFGHGNYRFLSKWWGHFLWFICCCIYVSDTEMMFHVTALGTGSESHLVLWLYHRHCLGSLVVQWLIVIFSVLGIKFSFPFLLLFWSFGISHLGFSTCKLFCKDICKFCIVLVEVF